MATKKIYRTIGVVPPATTEMYQDASGAWRRDGGATYDSKKRAWLTTSWKLVEPQYKVIYDNGKEEISKVPVSIYVAPVKPVEPIEPVEGEEGDIIDEPTEPVEEVEDNTPKVIKVEDVPASWQLENQYVSSSEKPEWQEYLAREIIGVEPIVAPMPQERENGGDWLAQRVKRAKNASYGIPIVRQIR
jgi:hypothetical protein